MRIDVRRRRREDPGHRDERLRGHRPLRSSRLSAGANDTDVTPGDVERWVRHADAGGAADADRAVPERGPARGAAVGRAQRMERAAIEPGGRDLQLVWVSLKQASSHRSRRVQRPG